MASERAGLTGMFTSLKHILVDHVKTTWSPFKRTEGTNIIKDIFSDQKNIRKLGIRVMHVALVVLLGLNALSIASAFIFSCPWVFNILSGLACATFVAGLGLAFFPKKIDHLIGMVANQVQKLRNLGSEG